MIERCFVIGPIGDQLADSGTPERQSYEESIEIFESIIQAACAEFEIEAYRSDDISRPGDIPEQIVQALRDEPFVIADLTGANPNVMYELGLRHTLKKVTIQVGEKGRLPFDVNTIRTVQFKRTSAGLIAGRKALVKSIGVALAQGFDLPTATRVWSEISDSGDLESVENAILRTDAGSPDAQAGCDEADDEPPGFLEYLAEMEEALPLVGERLGELNRLMGQITEVTNIEAASIGRASSSGQKLASVHRFASQLEPLGKQFDQNSVEFEAQTRLIHGGVEYLLVRMAANEDDALEAREFLVNVAGMGKVSGEAAKGGMRAFHDSLEPLLHAAAKLRPVVRLLRSALERLTTSFEVYTEWGRTAEAILAGLPPHEPSVDEDGGPDEVPANKES